MSRCNPGARKIVRLPGSLVVLGIALATSTFVHPARADVEAELLPIGSVAPAFSVKAHDGRVVDRNGLKGKYAVLYFYPRDDTPGCTRQAHGFRDNWDALQRAGVEVFGVSTDGNDSHQAFASKYELPFSLLPDERATLAMKFKVPIVGNAARRITYLIGPDGLVAHVWPKVNPDGHAQEILAKVAALGSAHNGGKVDGKAKNKPDKKTVRKQKSATPSPQQQ